MDIKAVTEILELKIGWPGLTEESRRTILAINSPITGVVRLWRESRSRQSIAFFYTRVIARAGLM